MIKELTAKYFGLMTQEDVNSKLADLLGSFKGTLLTDTFSQKLFEDETLTIHQQKAKCKLYFNTNSFLEASVTNAVNSIIGDKPRIVSKEESLENYVNNYWLHDSNLRTAEREAILEACKSGDGYIEKIKTNLGFKYFNIEQAEDMYIDFDYQTMKPRRYLLRVNEGGKDFTINTPDGEITINAIEYSPDQIIHYKWGNSKKGIYGRSPICSALTDLKILNIIERSIAVISRYKAVPRKIITPENSTEEGTLSQNEVDVIKKQLEDSKDTKTPLIGKKLSSLDLSDGGKDINLQTYLDYFKRKITIILTPEFIMFGENANRATSREQKQIYYLAISAIRQYFLYTTQDAIFYGLMAVYSKLKEKGIELKLSSFEYQYGDYAVELPEEKTARWLSEWEKGLITMKKYYELIGYPDEALDVYYWEVFQTPANNDTGNTENTNEKKS